MFTSDTTVGFMGTLTGCDNNHTILHIHIRSSLSLDDQSWKVSMLVSMQKTVSNDITFKAVMISKENVRR